MSIYSDYYNIDGHDTIGFIIKVLWDCAEVKIHRKPQSYDDYLSTSDIFRLSSDEKGAYTPSDIERATKSDKALHQWNHDQQFIRVGYTVYTHDKCLGEIKGVIVEETPETFTVKFDRAPKVDSYVYYKV